jgi:predicted secreted hydrolase
MKRRGFLLESVSAVAAAQLLGLTGCSSGGTIPARGVAPSKVGPLFLAQLNAVGSAYPDAATMALLRSVASANPTPRQVEIGWNVLGAYCGTGLTVPTQIPPAPALAFPADHGEHFDTEIEWRYITLSLPLSNGGLVSVIANFFRKAVVPAANAPGVAPLNRQIYSTSIAVTIEMPGVPGVHYAFPNQTFAPVDGTVTVTNNPFSMTVGLNGLFGTSAVFPLHAHIEDPGDPSVGRPPIVVDVDCAASNPLFLQGLSGYVGPSTKPGEVPSVGYYYYSWPQQATTGTVTIAGTSYAVTNGLAWLDHQWGGAPAPAAGSPAFSWSGWCWFEFQLDGNRSLTLSAPHGPIVGGVLPASNPGFGTYVAADGSSRLFGVSLSVGAYVTSPATGARYPSDWTILIAGTGIDLLVKPVVTVQPQIMMMGSSAEYSEANGTVTAIGIIDGAGVAMSGVGYCEGVGFEDPAARQARDIGELKSGLG